MANVGKLLSLEVPMKFDKETANTVRYKAVEADEPLPFDTIYVSKWAARKLSRLGNGDFPSSLSVKVSLS